MIRSRITASIPAPRSIYRNSKRFHGPIDIFMSCQCLANYPYTPKH